MKMLTLSALFACVLLPQSVTPTWYDKSEEPYQHFAKWLTAIDTDTKGSLIKVCTGLSSKENKSPTEGCNADSKKMGTNGEDWKVMCTALGKTHECPTTKTPEYTSAITQISSCCLNICPKKGPPSRGFPSSEDCCAACAGPDEGIPKKDPTTESVGNFLVWAGAPTTGIVKGSCGQATPNVTKDCEDASKQGTTVDNWDAMCVALANFDCTSSDPTPTDVVNTFTKCCQDDKGCSDAGKNGTEQVQCCADCIEKSEAKPTQGPPPPPPSSSGKPTDAPSSTGSGDGDTTTEEPTTTEGGSDSDSAINIGASGLLVTLITMMAAGVNIA